MTIFSKAPYVCTPDGETKCRYLKNGEVKFELDCECGLTKDVNGTDIGYCPIPSRDDLKNYTVWMKKMWLGDNCHTYDRVLPVA